MFSWLFKFFILFVYFIFTISSEDKVFKIDVRIGNNVNDSIIEFYRNCKCVAYFGCPKILEYMQAGQNGELPVKCSDPTYFCCGNPSSPTETTSSTTTTTTSATTTTIKSVKSEATTLSTTTSTTTTESVLKPDLRNVNVSCGLPKTEINVRILNPNIESETTIPGEIPWIVEIFELKGQKYRFKCAGSLIHPKVVLTAQHCVRSNRENSLKIVASDQGTFRDLGNPELERNVSKIIRHPQYYSGGLYNDIALLILENNYVYADYLLNSICLPQKGQVFNGQRCLGVGWGPNPEHKVIPLKKVDIPVVEPGNCQSLLRKSRLGEKFNLHSSFICAGGEEGKDTCKGDGGGPLICMTDYRFFQAGIISWGVDVDTCGKLDQPGVYTNVVQFRDWINEELGRYNIVVN